jgi:hypothetical protein
VLSRVSRVHIWIAAALAAIVVGTGFIWSTRVAAGADAYGYVSQADLWLRGDLHIDQGFGASVPWPLARWTFTPLGYRPEPDGYRIVPQYAAGLPLFMAAFKVVAGQCALFWVVPLCGGVLVFATYVIGRQIGRPMVALAAAGIVATSPTMLFMLMAPMSDVPAAAAWAASIALALAESPLAAGIAAGLAILIRPNLAPAAGIIFVWIVWRGTLNGQLPLGQRCSRAVWFALPVAAGALCVAVVNARLYGSPFASGYDLTEGFSTSYVLPNIRRYGWWLVTAETPFALAGLLSLALPATRVWRTRESRGALPLFGAFAAVIWIAYLVYVPWDAWWYLRFLLPAWPPMAIGTASILAAFYGSSSRALRALAVVTLVGVDVAGLAQAVHRDAFAIARGEAKYVEVAKIVESVTDPDAVILSAQHSGSIRYYAGRLTLRWDVGDPAWLDRTVDWLAAHGHHPYFVLEPQEIDALRERYGPTNMSARLDWAPMVSFRGGAIRMYDGVRRDQNGPTVSQPPARPSHECLTQRPPPVLR